jgi:5-methylcytosine-specific restriction protein A
MSVVCCLQCNCNPNKTYVSKNTYEKHKQSMRHLLFSCKIENLELRKTISALEKQIGTLQKENSMLEYFVSHPRRRKVSDREKKICAANQAWRCKMCHELLDSCYEVDHIKPLFKGGSNTLDNLRALCPNCHRKKTQSEIPMRD